MRKKKTIKKDVEKLHHEINKLSLESSINPISIQHSKRNAKATVKLKDFILFNELSDTQRKNALKSIKFKNELKAIKESKGDGKAKSGGHYWKYAIDAISKSIGTQDLVHCHKQIARLKKKRSKHQPNHQACIDENIAVIESYLRFYQPRVIGLIGRLESLPVNPRLESVMYDGLEILLRPDLMFGGTTKGKNIIGGVCFLVSKRVKYNVVQRKAVAHFLFHYLKNKFKDNSDVIVSRDYCFCVDLMSKQFEVAPVRTAVPDKFLQRNRANCIDIWDSLDKI